MKKIAQKAQQSIGLVLILAFMSGVNVSAYASQSEVTLSKNNVKNTPVIEKNSPLKSVALNQLLKDAQAHKTTQPTTNPVIEAQDQRILTKFTYSPKNPMIVPNRKFNVMMD